MEVYEHTAVEDNSSSVAVAGVYDEPESACRLKVTLDRVKEQLGDAAGFDLHLWRLDILEMARFNDQIQEKMWQEVVGADFLVVSLADGHDGVVSPGLIDLLGKWSHARRGTRTVLFVNPNNDSGDRAGAAEALGQVARRYGLNFVCEQRVGEGHKNENLM